MNSPPSRSTPPVRSGFSPPQTPDTAATGLLISGVKAMSFGTVTGPITPPFTPTHSTNASPSQGSPSSPVLTSKSSIASARDILVYSGDLEFSLDASGRRVEYGRGAWSNVYRARPRLTDSVEQTNSLSTPPSSPESLAPVVAVKSPAHRQASAILHHEARILTHLHCLPASSAFLTPFHGFVPLTSCLVMSAIPLTLSTHATNLAARPPPALSPTEPILGTITWLALCRHLLEAVHWLHGIAHTIHGDIKPHNILLQPSSANQPSTIPGFPYRPLLVDFSSSHTASLPSSNSGALSAVTCEYTAPELLTSAVLSNPASLPSSAGDVFSLGVTLTSAATGNVSIYSGPGYVKNAKARQGWEVLGFVRAENGGLRTGMGGVVEQVVAPAVAKVEQRIKIQEWKTRVERILENKESEKEELQ